jgi:hypothetical protein
METSFLAIIRMALSVLSERVLTICSLWMTFGLACWVMYDPNMLRIYVLCGFALLGHIPSVMKERKSESGGSDA